jgi:hypothetical protein
MDCFDDDLLCSAIDNAPEHASNDYWKWSPETRAEYKQWVAAKQRKQQQQAAQIPATVSEDEGEGDDTVEEEDVAEEAAVEAETPATEEKPKKEPSKWVQYQQIARAELVEETPGSKPKLALVNKRAREYYIADGWGTK